MSKKPINITGIMWSGSVGPNGIGGLSIQIEYMGRWIEIGHENLAPETVFSEIIEPEGIRQVVLGDPTAVDPKLGE